jgi:hypothetical protein
VILATFGAAKGRLQEVSILLGCLNEDVGSLCGTELRETSPYILALLLCDLLKLLFLTRILGFALDILVGKVLTAGNGSKGVDTSLQSLEFFRSTFG